MRKSDIGVYGLGVMGRNLALNLEEQGFRVSVFNRIAPEEKNIVREFLEAEGKDKNFFGADSAKEFINSVDLPRKILLMIKAGTAVDEVIDQLIPWVDSGDILIDGGNSYYEDTARRVQRLSSKQIHFVGMGISGGETGARDGPSLMPGGSPEAWNPIKTILESIAAETPGGDPCCAWMGQGGAGHFVKMVHNGIEYADMQLMAEIYHLLRQGLEFSSIDIGEFFDKWNRGILESYLMEITADIFTVRDDSGEPLVEKILDAAGQHGTGKWAVNSALDLGVPTPLIASGVFSRIISGLKDLRSGGLTRLMGPHQSMKSAPSEVLDNLEKALLAARILVLSEGFFLLKAAGDTYGWSYRLDRVARTWQGGCIIRSQLLEPVEEAYLLDADLPHLLLSEYFMDQLEESISGLRSIVKEAIDAGIPVPAFSAAIAQYDALRSEWLPANLIQAQRDYFGAHRYERIDRSRGTFFHTEWRNLAHQNPEQQD